MTLEEEEATENQQSAHFALDARDAQGSPRRRAAKGLAGPSLVQTATRLAAMERRKFSTTN